MTTGTLQISGVALRRRVSATPYISRSSGESPARSTRGRGCMRLQNSHMRRVLAIGGNTHPAIPNSVTPCRTTRPSPILEPPLKHGEFDHIDPSADVQLPHRVRLVDFHCLD